MWAVRCLWLRRRKLDKETYCNWSHLGGWDHLSSSCSTMWNKIMRIFPHALQLWMHQHAIGKVKGQAEAFYPRKTLFHVRSYQISQRNNRNWPIFLSNTRRWQWRTVFSTLWFRVLNKLLNFLVKRCGFVINWLCLTICSRLVILISDNNLRAEVALIWL